MKQKFFVFATVFALILSACNTKQPQEPEVAKVEMLCGEEVLQVLPEQVIPLQKVCGYGEEAVVKDEPPAPAEPPVPVFSGIENPGELEEYSCSWLNNCTTRQVPENTFAITFKKVGPLNEANCDWKKLSEGETIDYSIIDEFLVYTNDSIPEGVTLEDFVEEASKTVWACQAHAETTITNRDTYYEKYSCSDMSKCTLVKVPMGTFTVGFTPITINGEKDCTTKVWSQGETIDYEGIGEIHTYDIDLPMTTLELFIESQKPFVASCN